MEKKNIKNQKQNVKIYLTQKKMKKIRIKTDIFFY